MKPPDAMVVDHAAIVEAVQLWVDAKFVEAERPRVDKVCEVGAAFGPFRIEFAKPGIGIDA
jgi:hypothetical protein